MDIGVVGAGVVGSAIALALSKCGYSVVAVASRSHSSASSLSRRIEDATGHACLVAESPQQVADRCDLVFITTPDDVIGSIASQVSWRPDQFVVHCSGSLPNSVLDAASQLGACVGCMHPLQTCASVEDAARKLAGSFFGLEAPAALLPILEKMVLDIGGRPITLTADERVLYHVAGVLASNYVVALFDKATDLWGSFGIDRQTATLALLPLLAGAVDNIRNLGPGRALTGPIVRGDVGTVQRHLRVLESSYPALLPLYKEMGISTVETARESGRLDSDAAERLSCILSPRQRWALGNNLEIPTESTVTETSGMMEVTRR